MAKKRLWSREEFIVVLNLYYKLPFGKLNHTTKEVIHGRSSSSHAGVPGGCVPVRGSVQCCIFSGGAGDRTSDVK